MKAVRTIEALKMIISALVLHAIFCIFDFRTAGFNGMYVILSFVLCLFYAGVVVFADRKIKKNYFYVLICILADAVFSLSLLVSDFDASVILFLVLIFFWSVFYRFKKTEKRDKYPSKIFIIVFIVLFFVSEIKGSSMLLEVSVLESIVFLVSGMFLDGACSNENFIEEHRHIQNFPEGQIRKSYFNLLSGFCGICFIVAFLLSLINIPVGFVAKQIRKVLVFIINIVFWDTGRTRPMEESFSAGGGGGDFTSIIETKELSRFSIILDDILTVLGIIFTIALILSLVIWLMIIIVRGLKKSKVIGIDKIEMVFSNDEYAKTRKTRKVYEEELSGNRKIRKIYKKYVLKVTKKNVLKSDTPRKIEKNILLDNERKEKITSIYEKARYSKDGCSKEDAETLKRAMKK